MNPEQLRDHNTHEWDEFVRSHPLGWICSLSGWRRAIEDAFPHIRGSVVVLRNEDNSICAGMPVYAVRSWLLGNRLVSIPFATLSDPLVKTPEQMVQLFDAAVAYGRQNGSSKVEVRMWRCAHVPRDRSLARVISHVHQFVPLERSRDELWKNLHETAIRQRIARALRNGVSVSEGRTNEDLSVLMRLVGESRRRLGLPAIPNRFFRHLREAFRDTGHVRMLLANDGHRTVAAGLFLEYGDTVIVEYVGEEAPRRSLGGSQLLYWEAIQEAQRRGLRRFSMGRTSISNEGLMAYKKRWGALSEDLPHLVHPASAAASASRHESRIYKFTRVMLRRLPYPLYRLLGGFLYSHWG